MIGIHIFFIIQFLSILITFIIVIYVLCIVINNNMNT